MQSHDECAFCGRTLQEVEVRDETTGYLMESRLDCVHCLDELAEDDYPPELEPSDEELAWLEAQEEPDEGYDESTNPSNGWRCPGD